MEGGSETGEVNEGVVGEEFEIPFDGSPATKGFDDGGVVIGHGMMHAADDRHAIQPTGSHGEEFADLNAGYGGGDRLIDAADFPGGVGLEIPQVEMTGAAVVEEEDAGADRGTAVGPLGGCGGAIQQRAEPECKGGHSSAGQQPSPRQ